MNLLRKAAVTSIVAFTLISCGKDEKSTQESPSEIAQQKSAESFSEVDAPEFILIPADGQNSQFLYQAEEDSEATVANALVSDSEIADSGSTESFSYGKNCSIEPWLCRPMYKTNRHRIGYGYYGDCFQNNRRYYRYRRAHLSYWNGSNYYGSYYDGYRNSDYWGNSYYGQYYDNYSRSKRTPYGAAGGYNNGGYSLPGYDSSQYNSYLRNLNQSGSQFPPSGQTLPFNPNDLPPFSPYDPYNPGSRSGGRSF